MATPQDPRTGTGTGTGRTTDADTGSRTGAASSTDAGTGSDAGSGPAPAPKRSPYSMSKGDASMRNIGWALGLTMVCVIVFGVIFFGVGRGVDREVPETSRLDVGASAQRAQQQAPFAVAEPTMDDGWSPRAASYAPEGRPTWTLRYTAPSNALITLLESEEVTAPQLAEAVPGAAPDGEVTISGVDCETLSADAGQRAISCSGKDWGLLVHGDAEDSELTAAATAAVDSIRAGGAAKAD